MFNSRRNPAFLGTILTFTILLGALFMVQPSLSMADRIQIQARAGSFSYTIQGDKPDSVYVVVSVNLNDPDSRQQYINANLDRGRELLTNNESRLVPVQVTFSKPVPVKEAHELITRTNFLVESYLVVGYTEASRERSTRAWFGPLNPDDIPDREVFDPRKGEEIVYQGIMVLVGQVMTDSNGLGELLYNDLVYLVDTSELELRGLLSSKHANVTLNKEVAISIPSPFWDLDW
jgi:hypothetical protein